MAQLDDYMTRKAAVLAERRADYSAEPEKAVVKLTASSRLAGNTGARPTRMGEVLFISDSSPALAGNALGPTAPEMLLGALASCLVHTYVIQAALMNIPLDHVEIEARGALDMMGVVGLSFEGAPKMHDMNYVARVESPAASTDIERLHIAVEAACPVLNTLRFPVDVSRQK